MHLGHRYALNSKEALKELAFGWPRIQFKTIFSQTETKMGFRID